MTSIFANSEVIKSLFDTRFDTVGIDGERAGWAISLVSRVDNGLDSIC